MAVQSNFKRRKKVNSTVNRKLLHTRQVSCRGYARDDGMWDIEGQLMDVRSVDCMNRQRVIIVGAGETLHGMGLQITVDATLRIVAARALTQHSPHGECKHVAAGYAALTDLTIGPGFLAQVKERFRGIKGCTHMTALIAPVAATAVQTVIADREQMLATPGDEAQGREMNLLGTCYAYRPGGEAFLAHASAGSESTGD